MLWRISKLGFTALKAVDLNQDILQAFFAVVGFGQGRQV
jgi:hypothetical protein